MEKITSPSFSQAEKPKTDFLELIKINSEKLIDLITQKLEIVKAKDEVNYVTELKDSLSENLRELQNTLQLLEQNNLSAKQKEEETLNIAAQYFGLKEKLSDNFTKHAALNEKAEPLFSQTEVTQIKSLFHDLTNYIDQLNLPEIDNQSSLAELRASLKSSGQKDLSYGDFVTGLAKKSENAAQHAQEKTLEKIAHLINSETVKRIFEKMQHSQILPKIAYGTTLFALGLLATNPFKELHAEVNVSTDDNGHLKIDANGIEIKHVDLSELNSAASTRLINDPELDYIYSFEMTLNGVNYQIENPAKLSEFIENETQRIVPEIEKITSRQLNLTDLKPDEWVYLSSKIVEDNLKYNDAAIKKDANGNTTVADNRENKTISNMPLDKLLMEYKKGGVCRHYAAAVKMVSEVLKQTSGSLYLQNVKIEELSVAVGQQQDSHAVNVIMEKTNTDQEKPGLATSYICATWDDDGVFADDLEIKPKDELSRDPNVSFIKELAEKNSFVDNNDLAKISQQIVENFPSHSAERLAADRYLVGYYLSQADDENLTAADRLTAFDQTKKHIYNQGFGQKTEKLTALTSYKYYLFDLAYFVEKNPNTETLFNLISTLEEAAKLDVDAKINYFRQIGESYLKLAELDKINGDLSFAEDDKQNAKTAFNWCLNCLGTQAYKDENYFDILSASKQLVQIYKDENAQEEISNMYQKILEHQLNDNCYHRFIREYIDTLRHHNHFDDSELTRHQDQLILAVEKITDQKLQESCQKDIEDFFKFKKKLFSNQKYAKQ